MKQVFVSFVFVFAFAAVGFGAVNDKGQQRSDQTVPDSERFRQYQAYKECSDAALERHLAKDEVLLCTAIYLELKLSFVDGVSLADYAQLDTVSRAEVNKQGYRAYRAWVDERIIGLR